LLQPRSPCSTSLKPFMGVSLCWHLLLSCMHTWALGPLSVPLCVCCSNA
jgi:hypothetical protein